LGIERGFTKSELPLALPFLNDDLLYRRPSATSHPQLIAPLWRASAAYSSHFPTVSPGRGSY